MGSLPRGEKYGLNIHCSASLFWLTACKAVSKMSVATSFVSRFGLIARELVMGVAVVTAHVSRIGVSGVHNSDNYSSTSHFRIIN